jgi:hypothetical protein
MLRNWTVSYLRIWTTITSTYHIITFVRKENSFSFHIRPCGLFPIRINLEIWILKAVGWTPWTGDQFCAKAGTYTGQYKYGNNGTRHPCREWDSIPLFQCLNGRTHIMPQITRSPQPENKLTDIIIAKTSPHSPNWFWGRPSLLSNGYRGSFPGGKAAGAWSWPFIYNHCRVKESVDLYIHFPYVFLA